MINYRKKTVTWREVLAFLGVLAVMFLGSDWASHAGSRSREEKLELARQEAVLEWEEIEPQSPMWQVTKGLNPKWEHESEEDYAKRLADHVANLNAHMAAKQRQILKEREAETARRQKRQTDSFRLMGWIGAIFLAVVVFKNLLVARQPLALVLTADGIVLKGGILSSDYYLPWERISEIQYRIRQDYDSQFVYFSKKLYFKSSDGTILASLDLEGLKDANVNHLYDDINRLAPHIKWYWP